MGILPARKYNQPRNDNSRIGMISNTHCSVTPPFLPLFLGVLAGRARPRCWEGRRPTVTALRLLVQRYSDHAAVSHTLVQGPPWAGISARESRLCAFSSGEVARGASGRGDTILNACCFTAVYSLEMHVFAEGKEDAGLPLSRCRLCHTGFNARLFPIPSEYPRRPYARWKSINGCTL